jgi:hypothetical protein
MGAPNSEVGYTSAITGRGDHEVYMDMWWRWEKKKSVALLEVGDFLSFIPTSRIASRMTN